MSSNKTKKKKTAKYTLESLESALKDIREGRQGIRETCRKYGIPRTTIQDRLSGKRADELKNRGPEPILGKCGEKEVVEWLINIAKCGFPVKKQELLDTVQKILKDLGKPNPFKDDRPGQTWFLSFLKRNPEVSRRSAEGINKARARVTEESIRLWFRELETFLSESGQSEVLKHPERIFNCDESGFSLCPKTGKVLGPKGFRNLYQVKAGNEKDNLTVLVTFNASGQVCPPLVVFPYLRPPKAVTDSMPPDWTLGRSETGWMRGDIFFEYIVNDFNLWVEKNNIQKPILLLADGHKSHMSLALSSMCEKLEIILYALPPNTTHMLQPADVSVFAPLKAHWRNIVRNFLSKPENTNSSVTKTIFCQLFKHIIKDPQITSNIVNGFRRCGLFPYDPNGVDYTKCVQNTMEQLNQRRDQGEKDITNQDLVSTRKVLRHLRPILKKKNVNVKLILREMKKLRKTESSEPQILYETGSDERTNSTVRLSSSLLTEENLSKGNPETSEPAPHSFLDEYNNNIGSTAEHNIFDIGLNDTHFPSPRPVGADQLSLPPPMEEIVVPLVPFHDFPVEVDVYQKPTTCDIQQPSNDGSLSTFHILGSFLEQETLVSLDDVVIIPVQTSTPTKPEWQTITSLAEISLPPVKSNLSSAQPHQSSTEATNLLGVLRKQPLSQDTVITKPRGPTAGSHSLTLIKVIPENDFSALDVACSQLGQRSLESLDDIIVLPFEKSLAASSEIESTGFSSQPEIRSENIISTSTQLYTTTKTSTVTSNAFSKHLFVPQPLEKSKQNVSKPRVPAAISSLLWRKHYEEKEKAKLEKKESVKRKQEESKRKKLENQQVKKRKTIKHKAVNRNELGLNTVKNKENRSDKQNCAQCKVILNSDTEEDEDKNVGCDFCAKWFHLKCTDFIGLNYDDVKDRSFKCNSCI